MFSPLMLKVISFCCRLFLQTCQSNSAVSPTFVPHHPAFTEAAVLIPRGTRVLVTLVMTELNVNMMLTIALPIHVIMGRNVWMVSMATRATVSLASQVRCLLGSGSLYYVIMSSMLHPLSYSNIFMYRVFNAPILIFYEYFYMFKWRLFYGKRGVDPGDDCEVDDDECNCSVAGTDTSSPNGGCVDLINDFRCTCRDGFTGHDCSVSENRIQNKATLA